MEFPTRYQYRVGGTVPKPRASRPAFPAVDAVVAMVAPRSTATPASSRLASRRLASDFRILFPAAVMLPLWAGVAHILICILDHGYYIAAITYVPANLFLAGIRTAVHMYADAQKAPLLYANIWLSIHVLGAVHGVLSSVILADLEAVPAGGPVIVGCFAAIWAVVCTVEGPVLKLPLRHRILGHACVLVRRAPSALLVAHAAPPLVPTLCGPPWALLARTHTHTHTRTHTHGAATLWAPARRPRTCRLRRCRTSGSQASPCSSPPFWSWATSTA